MQLQLADKFVFDRYEIVGDNKEIQFHYRIDFHDASVALCERWVLPARIEMTSDETLQRILQHMHIGVGISYFKAFIPPVEVPYALSVQEAEYWNMVYGQGLAEFCFENKIPHLLQPFTATAGVVPATPIVLDTTGALLGIGGGKDSIVAGELLKHARIPFTAFVLATGDHHGQAGSVVSAMQANNLEVKRYLDRQIISLTKDRTGYNGHVPISMLFAWAGVLLAFLQHAKYVIVANEAAASIGNAQWQGGSVNHQWSKSLEFERLMQAYVRTHFTPDIIYTSTIRHLSSLAVAKLFAQLGDKYLDHFTSCNLVLRIDPAQRPNGRWCGQCAKCLSSYLLLSVFLQPDQLQSVFGKDMLADMQLQPTFRQLLGLKGNKPMDCVGTIEELRACVRELLQRGNTAPLLQTVRQADLSGPGVAELITKRYPHQMPAPLLTATEDTARSVGL